MTLNLEQLFIGASAGYRALLGSCFLAAARRFPSA